MKEFNNFLLSTNLNLSLDYSKRFKEIKMLEKTWKAALEWANSKITNQEPEDIREFIKKELED